MQRSDSPFGWLPGITSSARARFGEDAPVTRRGRDPLDVELVDVELQDEIEVLMRLIEAAATTSEPLGLADIDALLFQPR